MKKIELQNQEFFTYCENEKSLVSGGELTGTYMLCQNNSQAVICLDTNDVYLISENH